jgi:hypothetical protein
MAFCTKRVSAARQVERRDRYARLGQRHDIASAQAAPAAGDHRHLSVQTEQLVEKMA